MSTEVKEKPRIETLQLKVGGMSCSFCAESIRKAVGRQPAELLPMTNLHGLVIGTRNPWAS